MGNSVNVLPGIFDQLSYDTLASRLLGGYGFTFSTIWWPITNAGSSTAHWSYLYTFYLTGVYWLFGPYPIIARLIQAILTGFLTPWLTYRITCRVFSSVEADASPRIGLVAAAWVAVYPYFLYYSAALMTESFFIVGVLWIMDCVQRISDMRESERPVIWGGVELGLAIGITALLRQLLLLIVPFLLLYIWWAKKQYHQIKACRSAMAYGAISIITFSVIIAPFTIFNYKQFNRFVLLNTNAGYAFFWANHPIYGDRFLPILPEEMGSYQDLIPNELRSLDEAALDQALLKRGIDFVLADPVRYVRLSLSRIPAYFMFWPSRNSGLTSNLSRVLSFGLALPFMLLGTALWIRDVAKKILDPVPGALLLLFALVFSAIHLLSWALIRYRLPVDAVMLVFAAYGLLVVLTWIFHNPPFKNPL